MFEQFDRLDEIEDKIIKNLDKWIDLLDKFIETRQFTQDELYSVVSDYFPTVPVKDFVDYLILDGYIEVDENDENLYRVSDKSFNEYNFLTDPNYYELIEELLKYEEEALDGEDPYEELE